MTAERIDAGSTTAAAERGPAAGADKGTIALAGCAPLVTSEAIAGTGDGLAEALVAAAAALMEFTAEIKHGSRELLITSKSAATAAAASAASLFASYADTSELMSKGPLTP